MQPPRDSKIITDFIVREVKERKSEGVVIGLSGGVDSSVAVALAVKALGPSRVLGLILPDSKTIPHPRERKDAIGLAKDLKISHKVIEIGSAKNDLMRQLPSNKFVQGNLAVRLRMCILYYYAAIRHLLVVGTSDRSELELGYFTKYGDGAADILPIGGLYKTEVREIGRYMHIPHRILEKKSTPGLWKGQTAEAEIGLSYEEIDDILRHLKRNTSHLRKFSDEKVQNVIKLVEQNRHKRSLPPVCKI
ncbi:MAG: NAD+ synthase [Candidatus Nitrosopolaris sp.]